MWLDIIKERRKELNFTIKHISEAASLPERTVSRIFSGETEDPYATNLHRIAVVLDLSLDDLLADGASVVGGKRFAVIKDELDAATEEISKLTAEAERLTSENSLLSAENSMLKDKVGVLTAENDILRLNLEHKDELLSLHNYYNKKMND